VLAGAPARFALAGLSLGGYVAWEVLRQAPERVTRLALLDTSARPDSAEQTARRRGLLALGEASGLPPVLDALWPAVVGPARQDDLALRRRFDAMSLRLGWPVFARQQEAIIGRPDSRADLAGVAVPALVLCGRDDAITPLEVSEEMAAGIPGAELVVLDDCGHLSTWERPDAVTEALSAWLARA
jgi:pimeloyl-ACP methyl ester carboxylesterase